MKLKNLDEKMTRNLVAEDSKLKVRPRSHSYSRSRSVSYRRGLQLNAWHARYLMSGSRRNSSWCKIM